MDKAAVLAALYNASQPQGAGFMHYDPKPMTVDEASKILTQTTEFDYLKGRVMKLDLKGEDFDPRGYDRDNGQGAAQKAIDTLKASGDPNNKVIATDHSARARTQAMNTRAQLGDGHSVRREGGVPVFQMGLADMAPHLGPRVDRVLKKS